MKLVFMGTAPFAVPCLLAAANAGHQILTVVTQPDRPRGRGMALLPSAVKVAALNLNLPIWVTDEPVPQEPGVLRGTPEQLESAIEPFRELGVQHLALQFMVPHYPERLVQIERFATWRDASRNVQAVMIGRPGHVVHGTKCALGPVPSNRMLDATP